ncbi:polysaccharide deacetylase family protein [Vallitalea sediminicola]
MESNKKKAVILSYDDGVTNDRRLVELFNKYNLKGTFHLNSGKLDTEGHLNSAEIKELFQGHEVSAHSLTHPWLTKLTKEQIFEEMNTDKTNLEALMGHEVKGMSYPYGAYDDKTFEVLNELDIQYGRTTRSTLDFTIPKDFLKLHPTCHHSRLDQVIDKFLEDENAQLLYVWGHSYEFVSEESWEQLEKLLKKLLRDDIWSTTNIEFVRYRLKNKRC